MTVHSAFPNPASSRGINPQLPEFSTRLTNPMLPCTLAFQRFDMLDHKVENPIKICCVI